MFLNNQIKYFLIFSGRVGSKSITNMLDGYVVGNFKDGSPVSHFGEYSR